MIIGQRPFRPGFLSHVSSDGDPRSTLEQTTRLFQIAEELGYDSVWVAQHHVRAECIVERQRELAHHAVRS